MRFSGWVPAAARQAIGSRAAEVLTAAIWLIWTEHPRHQQQL
jgi:hypothetical protein